MLSQENRLEKRKEFAYLYNHGQAKHSTNITLVYLPTKFRTVKIGFSVTKKIGKAFVRNRVKRVMRAVVREFVKDLPNEYNIVFIAKSGIENLTYKDVYEQVKILIDKSGLCKLKENTNV